MGIGAEVAKIAMAMLVVVFAYNLVSSGNTSGIINSSATGSASVIHALEGK